MDEKVCTWVRAQIPQNHKQHKQQQQKTCCKQCLWLKTRLSDLSEVDGTFTLKSDGNRMLGFQREQHSFGWLLTGFGTAVHRGHATDVAPLTNRKLLLLPNGKNWPEHCFSCITPSSEEFSKHHLSLCKCFLWDFYKTDPWVESTTFRKHSVLPARFINPQFHCFAFSAGGSSGNDELNAVNTSTLFTQCCAVVWKQSSNITSRKSLMGNIVVAAERCGMEVWNQYQQRSLPPHGEKGIYYEEIMIYVKAKRGVRLCRGQRYEPIMINGSHSFAYPAPHPERPAAELVSAPAPVLIVSFGSVIFYPLFFHPFPSSAPSLFSPQFSLFALRR